LLPLIDGAAAGDEKAFSDLAEMYKPLLESMARKYAAMVDGGAASEEDLLQEATMALYSAVRSYNRSDKVTFGLYAKICIRNRLVSFLRAYSAKGKRIESGKEEYSEPSQSFFERENARETEGKIRSALSELEWEVFKLYVSKKSYAEIAESLGRSEKTVDNAIYRIKSKLKRLI